MAYLLDIAGSFIIAAMAILISFAINLNITTSASVILFTNIEQQKLTSVVELIEYDFYKIGYRVSKDKIAIADSIEIKLYTDIDNNDSVDSVHYYLGTISELSSTSNPNDKPLYRQKNNEQIRTQHPVVEFNLSYYDSIGNFLAYSSLKNSTGINHIKSIKVKIKVESGELYNEKYRTAEWKKKISPKNLR